MEALPNMRLGVYEAEHLNQLSQRQVEISQSAFCVYAKMVALWLCLCMYVLSRGITYLSEVGPCGMRLGRFAMSMDAGRYVRIRYYTVYMHFVSKKQNF